MAARGHDRHRQPDTGRAAVAGRSRLPYPQRDLAEAARTPRSRPRRCRPADSRRAPGHHARPGTSGDSPALTAPPSDPAAAGSGPAAPGIVTLNEPESRRRPALPPVEAPPAPSPARHIRGRMPWSAIWRTGVVADAFIWSGLAAVGGPGQPLIAAVVRACRAGEVIRSAAVGARESGTSAGRSLAGSAQPRYAAAGSPARMGSRCER